LFLSANINQMNSLQDAYHAIHEIHKNTVQIWLHTSLFTWEWWLGVGLTVIPWVIWFVFRKQDSTDRLLYAGLFIMIIALWLDFIGVSLGLWSYNYSVVPFIPAYIPWDFSLIPTIVMLLLQYKPGINPFIKAIVFGFLSAFVGGPIFKWIDLYNMEEWKHIFSFGIYMVLYIVTHYISKRNHFRPLSRS